MPNTTNYNWATPADTDLVKDGAAAIRTLGSSADTTVKNLNPGTTAGDIDYYTSSTAKARVAIGTAGQVLRVNSGGTAPEWATTADQTPLTTKGDLFGFNTADARIPIGTNGQVLIADSAQSLGLKWGVDPTTDVVTTAGDLIYGTAADTVARLGIGTAGQVLQVNSGATAPEWVTTSSGSMTQLASQTFSNTASHTFSSISGSYKALALLLRSVRSTTNEQAIRIRFNSDTGTSYNQSAWTDSGSVALANTGITVLRDPRESFATTLGWVYMMDYANAVTHKMAEVRAVQSSTGGGGGYVQYGQLGIWSGTAAISSITIYAASGNLQAGTAILYGVN